MTQRLRPLPNPSELLLAVGCSAVFARSPAASLTVYFLRFLTSPLFVFFAVFLCQNYSVPHSMSARPVGGAVLHILLLF